MGRDIVPEQARQPDAGDVALDHLRPPEGSREHRDQLADGHDVGSFQAPRAGQLDVEVVRDREHGSEIPDRDGRERQVGLAPDDGRRFERPGHDRGEPRGAHAHDRRAPDDRVLQTRGRDGFLGEALRPQERSGGIGRCPGNRDQQEAADARVAGGVECTEHRSMVGVPEGVVVGLIRAAHKVHEGEHAAEDLGEGVSVVEPAERDLGAERP